MKLTIILASMGFVTTGDESIKRDEGIYSTQYRLHMYLQMRLIPSSPQSPFGFFFFFFRFFKVFPFITLTSFDTYVALYATVV